MTNSQHIYEVRPRKDHRAFDLISDALPESFLIAGRRVKWMMCQPMQTRCLLIMALSAASALSALAEPPVKLDCTIRYWNEHFRKEKEHDSQHGYSTTKVAPKDIAWLRPGGSPVGRLGQVGPTYGFVVLGWCKKGNVTSTTELRNLMIKLSKLASDHGANAMSYDKSGTEIRFYFLRLEDAIFAAAKSGKGSIANRPGVPLVIPISR
jgi:hypothetical protein